MYAIGVGKWLIQFYMCNELNWCFVNHRIATQQAHIIQASADETGPITLG